MDDSLLVRKKTLLEKLSQETDAQLHALENEDPEAFLKSVENGEYIIEQMKMIDSSEFYSDAILIEKLKEIFKKRETISSLIPPLQEKISGNLIQVNVKKKINMYQQENMYKPPSVFFDQRK